MRIALITGSCGLVGSESAYFLIKKVSKLLESITIIGNFSLGKTEMLLG